MMTDIGNRKEILRIFRESIVFIIRPFKLFKSDIIYPKRLLIFLVAIKGWRKILVLSTQQWLNFISPNGSLRLSLANASSKSARFVRACEKSARVLAGNIFASEHTQTSHVSHARIARIARIAQWLESCVSRRNESLLAG